MDKERLRPAFIVGGVLTSTTIALSSCVESSTPPPGFSTDTDDYKYEAVMDVGQGNEVKFYTNDEPKLEIAGGMAYIEAKNVYCPPDGDGDNVGCDDDFYEFFKFASPKRITVKPKHSIED